ncbi:MAG: hypothetical protein JW969_06890 [Spirochaetales bacterium]|nr:hypothetical protein [Spirochaetales bacterium]
MVIINRLKNFLQRPFIKDTLSTSILSVLGKSAGILVPLFIATWFGVSNTVDSFFLSYSIILFISNIFGTTMLKVIVPYLVELNSLKKDIGLFTSSILLINSLFFVLLFVIVVVFIKSILQLVSNFNESDLNSITMFIIEMVPVIFFLICSNIFDGVLNSLKKFSLSALSPFIRSIIIILVIVLTKDYLGIHAIIVGYVTGEFSRVLILFLVLIKKRIIKFRLSFKLDKRLVDFLRQGLYQIIAMVLFGMNPLVDKVMASWKGEGSLSILYYADRIYIIPVLLLTSGFLVTLLPYISRKLYLENREKFLVFIHKVVKYVSIIVSSIVFIGLLIYRPLISFIFSIAKLPVGIITDIQNVFIGYFIGLFPYLISQVYGFALIAIKQTLLIMLLSSITFLLNIVFNYILMSPFGLPGLSYSTSLIRVINCLSYIIGFYLYYKKLKKGEFIHEK